MVGVGRGAAVEVNSGMPKILVDDLTLFEGKSMSHEIWRDYLNGKGKQTRKRLRVGSWKIFGTSFLLSGLVGFRIGW